MQGGGNGPAGSEPWGHGRPPTLPLSPLQGQVLPHWELLEPWYLVATGAGTAVGAEGVVLAGALVLTGAGEAWVALRLDTQGRWACRTGGEEVTTSVGSDGEVSICGHQHRGQSLSSVWEQSLPR